MRKERSSAGWLLTSKLSEILSRDGYSPLSEVGKGCNTQLEYLDEYLNRGAQMSDKQAHEIASLIVRRTRERKGISEMEIIQIAAYINTCDPNTY